MFRSVALISLYPLNSIGGGERYTFNTAEAIRVSGDQCRIFARANTGPGSLALPDRLKLPFVEWTSESVASNSLALERLLLEVAQFDVIWIHQYLSSDGVFDLIAAAIADQLVFFTNLGHEVLFPEFQAFYCRAPNHFFIEISDYSAKRSRAFRASTLGITGSIWSKQFAGLSAASSRDNNLEVSSVGRVLPHKGIDVTIAGLPDRWRLNVIGPSGDLDYANYLAAVSVGKDVRFLGPVPEDVKRSIMSRACCLVASSCHETYLGQKIPQAELLGLVIFEAIALGVLPITSDIPSFKEVMTRLGLSEWVYAARNPAELERRLQRAALLDNSARLRLIQHAASVIRTEYVWDSYWQRVLNATSTSPRSAQAAGSGL